MASDSNSRYISTNGVAKALGVSVSTVKRWVDEGVLPAHKTSGGHRKLLVADVLELVRRSDLPHADLSQLMSLPRSDKVPKVPELAEQLHQALVSGDAGKVRMLTVGMYRRGMSVEHLADRGIAPAMECIGHAWANGKLDVMEEHRATQLCVASLYELKAILEERVSKDPPRAVGGAPEQDSSMLPGLLAQMVLIDAGWDAINLGPSTPFQSFAKALHDLRPRLMWLSISHLGDEGEFVSGYRGLYQQAEKMGVAVAIGGRALVEPMRSKIPYTTYGDGLGHLAAFARTLHPRPGRPRRGRPRGTG